MFKITHGLLEFPMASTFTHPARKELRGHAYKFHNSDAVRAVANSPSHFGLTHFGTNYRLR